MRTTDSDGEVLLSYEADTDNFIRYRGSKNGKEITVYLDRKLRNTLHGHVPINLKAIVRIDERGEDRNEVPPMSPFRLRELERKAKKFEEFRAAQLEALREIQNNTARQTFLFSQLVNAVGAAANANTQNNRSDRTEKRSKRSR